VYHFLYLLAGDTDLNQNGLRKNIIHVKGIKSASRKRKNLYLLAGDTDFPKSEKNTGKVSPYADG